MMPEHTPAPTPARSLYGFFLYLFSKIVLAIYCAWAFIPDKYLHYVNIYYYPQKYWATAVPIQCLVALTIFVFLIYPSLHLMLTVSEDSTKTILDSHHATPNFTEICVNGNQECICKDSKNCLKDQYSRPPQDVHENTVPPLQNIDIRIVCKKLYGDVIQ